MRLCTFLDAPDSTERPGALVSNHIIDLQAAHKHLHAATDFPASLLDLLAAGDDALARARRIVEHATDETNLHTLIEQNIARPFETVRFRPPITRPGKIICIGQNYRAHVHEMKREPPKYPMFFAKFANTLIGHKESIRLPRVSQQVDYEAELMIVIGRTCKDVSRAQAFDYIAGYTVFNDVSVRDYQRRTSQFLQGKTFDTTGPTGPCIVTADEVADPESLRVQLRLNGETMQDSTTADFIFDIRTIIAYLSEIMTLEPGDLIATGTPGGVGFARDPQVFLQAGDVVEVEIDGLGVLQNKVVAPERGGYAKG